MLSVDGDADAAVTVSIRTGWFKLRSLVSFKDVFLLLQGKVYDACVQSCVLHESEKRK